MSEVKDVQTDFGVKPRCTVTVSNGIETHAKEWNLNKQNINYLVENFGNDSIKWIGKKVGVFTESIKGNLAIRIKEAGN